MNLINSIATAVLQMSGLIDKLKALKEKLQEQLPDLNLQGASKKQLIYIPVRVSDQGRTPGKTNKGS